MSHPRELTLLAVFASALGLAFFAAPFANAQPILDGRLLFMDSKKGNCAACHQAPRDSAVKIASTVAKPLANISAKFTAEALRVAIADYRATAASGEASIMPPYLPHRILTEAELDAVVAYVIQL